MENWVEYVGYLASILVGITFTMKTMIPLRSIAIASNVAFIIYGFYGELYPVLILHSLMLPLNIFRLFQMKNLVDKVDAATKGGYSFEWLVPYMSKEEFKKGEKVFNKNDKADKLYYIQEGTVKFPEFSKVVKSGNVFGEIGIFSPFNKRTATAVCQENVVLYTIGKRKIMQLYYQNPKFGFYLIQLLTLRFVEDIK